MELADTTVLILARRDARVRDWLRQAATANEVTLCDQTILEYVRGARNAREFEEYESALAGYPRARVESADWDRSRETFRELAAVTGGYQQSVPIPDSLIAAVAERLGLTLVHYDEDFERIAAVTGQAHRWVVPRGSA